MPISDKYKLIFIHIPKCAGISVWRALDLAETSDNLITFSSPILQHALPKQLKGKYISNKTWAEYKKFTIIRNPYDRVVSDYFWMKNDAHASSLITGSFDDFLALREEVVNNNKYKEDIYFDHFYPMHFYFEGIKYDHVLRFENINKGFDKLRKLYHIENALPKVNNSIKEGFVLNEQQKDRIYKLYKKDFVRFKYKKQYEGNTQESNKQNSIVVNNENLINSLREEINRLQNQNDQIENEKNQLIVALQNEKMQIENEKNQFIAAQYIEKTEIEKQRDNVINERDSVIGERNNLKEQLSSLNEILGHVKNENNALLNGLETKGQVIQELSSNKIHLEKELNQKDNLIAQATIDKEAIEKEFAKISAEVKVLGKNLSDRDISILKYESETLQLRLKIEHLDRMLISEKENNLKAAMESGSHIKQLIQDNTALLTELSFNKEIIGKLNSEKDKLEQSLLKISIEARALEESISKKEKHILDNQSLIEQLRGQKLDIENALTFEKESHSEAVRVMSSLNDQSTKVKELLLSEISLKNEVISKISKECSNLEDKLVENKNNYEREIRKLTENVLNNEQALLKMKELNREFEDSVKWYMDTYENRSIFGIMKYKVLKK